MDLLFVRDPLLNAVNFLHQLHGDEEQSPAKNYLRDRNAMASTAVDVKEYSESYVFVADMPGLKSADVKVTVENGNVLILSGERKKEQEGETVKYLSIERRPLKFMRKFSLPSNANTEEISASCEDGVLTVTVPKIPPPTPKVVNIDVN